jgi:hypothetical protein
MLKGETTGLRTTEDYLEQGLELKDEIAAKIDQSRREIAAGKYTTRRPR